MALTDGCWEPKVVIEKRDKGPLVMTISAQTLFSATAASLAVAGGCVGAYQHVMTMAPTTRIANKWQVAASR